MAFSVEPFCWYPSKTTELTRRKEDWRAWAFVMAVKGQLVNGYADIPINGVWYRLQHSNQEDALDWFAAWASERIEALLPQGTTDLVPMPGHADVNDESTLRMGLVAKRIADRLGSRVVVQDILRFKKIMPSAHKTGTRESRDVEKIFNNIRYKETLPRKAGHTIILDDVVTSGAHLQAAAGILTLSGHRVVLALCAGRTTSVQYQSMFQVSPTSYTAYPDSLGNGANGWRQAA